MRGGYLSEGARGLRLTREVLVRVRRKALRRGCWYRVLRVLERGVVDLAIRCVDEVKSVRLGNALTKILVKLIDFFGPGYLDMVERVGCPLAAGVSRLALSWGNKEAVKWRDDQALIRYLGFCKLRLGMFG